MTPLHATGSPEPFRAHGPYADEQHGIGTHINFAALGSMLRWRQLGSNLCARMCHHLCDGWAHTRVRMPARTPPPILLLPVGRPRARS